MTNYELYEELRTLIGKGYPGEITSEKVVEQVKWLISKPVEIRHVDGTLYEYTGGMTKKVKGNWRQTGLF